MHAEAENASVELVDTHCHIDLFGKDEIAVVRAVELRHVHTIAVTNAPSVFFHTRDTARGCRFLYPAIGLHPELVADRRHEIEKMWVHLDETRFVGEVGLDYVTTDQERRRQQRDVFAKIVSKCAEMGGKVLTIHSRRAVSDVLSVLGPEFPGTAILHWFSGTPRELEQAASLGCWFSVNPAMLRSESGCRLIDLMPRDRILTETDGPFVTVGRRPARPEDVGDVIKGLANAWEETADEAARRVLRNFELAAGLEGDRGLSRT